MKRARKRIIADLNRIAAALDTKAVAKDEVSVKDRVVVDMGKNGYFLATVKSKRGNKIGVVFDDGESATLPLTKIVGKGTSRKRVNPIQKNELEKFLKTEKGEPDLTKFKKQPRRKAIPKPPTMEPAKKPGRNPKHPKFAFNVNTRFLIDFGPNGVYPATVTAIRGDKAYFILDDGDKLNMDMADPAILGFAISRKRKTAIPKSEIKKWMATAPKEDTGPKPKTKSEKKRVANLAFEKGFRYLVDTGSDGIFAGTMTALRNGKVHIMLDNGKKEVLDKNSDKWLGYTVPRQRKAPIPRTALKKWLKNQPSTGVPVQPIEEQMKAKMTKGPEKKKRKKKKNGDKPKKKKPPQPDLTNSAAAKMYIKGLQEDLKQMGIESRNNNAQLTITSPINVENVLRRNGWQKMQTKSVRVEEQDVWVSMTYMRKATTVIKVSTSGKKATSVMDVSKQGTTYIGVVKL